MRFKHGVGVIGWGELVSYMISNIEQWNNEALSSI